MPIRAENRARYPSDWPALSLLIRQLALWQCQECGAGNGEPHPLTGSRVVLTVAHLDHTPENCQPENLRAWCQKCHNTYDAPMRRRGIRERERARMAVGELLEDVRP